MLVDMSDRDGGSPERGDIAMAAWGTVKGMYMPDEVKTFDIGGKTCG